MIGIIDYGMGNLASVRNALEQIGYDAIVVAEPQAAVSYERLILPGVGAFAQAMQSIEATGWAGALREFAASGKPLLGICLGMQLLFERGYEHSQAFGEQYDETQGGTAGLGLIPGQVLRMRPEPPHRLPHVGWNSLLHARKHPLFAGVKDHVDVYFVHSYACQPSDEADVIARCEHGGQFVASVARGNVAGMQFHPEKSQPMGLRLLENFVQWDGA